MYRRKHFQRIQNKLLEHKALVTFEHTSKMKLGILIGWDQTITEKTKELTYQKQEISKTTSENNFLVNLRVKIILSNTLKFI